MSFANPATARWDKELGRAVPLDPDGEGERVLTSYRDGQVTVKGVVHNILVPNSIAGKAETYGLPTATLVKAGALKRLKDAIDRYEAELDGRAIPAAPVRSPESTDTRQQLGLEITARRKEMKLSRHQLSAAVQHAVDLAGGNWHHGWSPSAVQAWELGKSAPRDIEPVITVLHAPDAMALRWRHWWLTSRVGIPERERQACLERIGGMKAEMAARDPEAAAKARLANTIDEVRRALDAKEGKQVDTPEAMVSLEELPGPDEELALASLEEAEAMVAARAAEVAQREAETQERLGITN